MKNDNLFTEKTVRKTPFWQDLSVGVLMIIGMGMIFAFGIPYMEEQLDDKMEKKYIKQPLSDSYQAVFTDSNLTFYGKITDMYGRYMTLEDVFYLKKSKPVIDSETGKAIPPEHPLDLIKFGDEVYGPEDALYLQSEHVLYWVNMKETSKVVQAIKKHKEIQTQK